MVTQKNQDTSICRKQSLLQQYLKNETLDIKDIVSMACDMLLAGVDTVSFLKLIISYIHRIKLINFLRIIIIKNKNVMKEMRYSF